MARGVWVRINAESAAKLRAFLDAHPKASLMELSGLMRCSYRTVRKIAEEYDIVLPHRPYTKETRNRHPLLHPLFKELERRGVSLDEVGRQLQTSTFSIYRLRNGEREPRLFEVECLAMMADMQLALEPRKRG